MASSEPHASSLRLSSKTISLNRIIIAVGATGTGKSTIINMLFNNDVTKDALTRPAETGHTMDPVTTCTKWYVSPANECIFTDTIGLGDPQKSELEIVLSIKRLFKKFELGFHCVLLVVKYGRFTEQERINVLALDKIFDKNWKKNCVLVVTHYDGETDEASMQDALDKWIGSTEETAATQTEKGTSDSEGELFKSLISQLANRIVFSDNGTGRHFTYNTAFRQQSLNKLNMYIEQLSENVVGPAPDTLLDRIRSILEIYFTFYRLARAKERISNAIAYLKDHGDSGSCQCSICLEEIIAAEMCTPNCECGNIFHEKCLNEMKSYRISTCPLCRGKISEVRRLKFTVPLR